VTRGCEDPLAWIGGALADLHERDLHRSLRHHASAADPWIELVDPDDPTAPLRRVLHLCSNGYLGLASHPAVVEAAAEAAARHGTSAGASRLVTGGQSPHRALERDLAAWKGTEDAVLTSSGYLANLAVVTALVGRGDTVVSDARNHASIVDACRLSGAEIRVHAHGDPEHAEALLADAPGRRLLVTDGVFSMDGDLAPLPALCDVAERHGAAVVVDDAHGTGVLGPDGRGTAAALGCEDRVHAVVGTLSKALASVGGFVAGSTDLVDWLRNRARPVVFDTALPAPAVAAAHAALRVARSEPDRRRRVLAHA
jgi:8-amino-7-oxononanoate synthase